jgi:hypothetical protein
MAFVLGGLLSSGSPALGQCEQARVIGDRSGMEDDFGRVVGIWGSVAIVGNSPGNDSKGAAYIFRHDGKTWTREARLIVPDGQPEDTFGSSVGIAGDIVAIGDTRKRTSKTGRGAVYIFRFDRGKWRQTALLAALDGFGGNSFGFSVAIDAGPPMRVIVGDRDDWTPERQSGSAYVFRYDSEQATWIEEQKLTASDADERDLFGVAVSIKRDVVLVGAHGDEEGGLVAGAAYVFRYAAEEGGWFEEAKLMGWGSDRAKWFGRSVQLDEGGGTALIGAPETNSQNGAAYIFRYDPDTSEWTEEGILVAAEPRGPFPKLGSSVAIHGNVAVAGATHQIIDGIDGGAAHVFHFDGKDWKEVAELTASDNHGGALFGRSAAISGNLTIIGAPDQGPYGSAYVFAIACPDFDSDGDIDLEDFRVFGQCVTGPGRSNPPLTCPPGAFTTADLDYDLDVDSADFARFQQTFTGPLDSPLKNARAPF